MIELNNREYDWQVKQALTVPLLVMGTEKPLVVLNATLCLAYILASHMGIAAFIAPVLFLFIHGLCVRISKHDPCMMRVFKRSTRYKGYYPAVPLEHSRLEDKKRGSRPFNSTPKELLNVKF